MKMKRKTSNSKEIIFYFMVGIVVIMCFYLIIKVKDESVTCMANPLQYGVKNLQASDKSDITCMCTSPTSEQILVVTKDNLTMMDKFTLFTTSP